MASLSQLRRDLAELRSLAELKTSGPKNGIIIYDPDRGSMPDLSILPADGFYILLPAKDGDPDRGNWEGPYLDPVNPEPMGAGGASILNLKYEDCGEA